jgi:hypothetical protein
MTTEFQAYYNWSLIDRLNNRHCTASNTDKSREMNNKEDTTACHVLLFRMEKLSRAAYKRVAAWLAVGWGEGANNPSP